MADYKYKPSIMIDDLLDGLKAVQKEAVSADKIIGMIGNKGNLNKLLAVFMSMDSMIEDLIQDSDQLKSTFGTQLKGGFFANLNDELGKLSDLIKQTQKMSTDVLGIDLKKSGASTQLKDMANQINAVLDSLGVSNKIDFNVFDTKSLKEQRDELIGYINNIGSEITLSVGKIDVSQLGNVGGRIAKGFDDAGKQVQKSASKLKSIIKKAVEEFYNATLDEDASAQQKAMKSLQSRLGYNDVDFKNIKGIFKQLDEGTTEEDDAVKAILGLIDDINNVTSTASSALNEGKAILIREFKAYFNAIEDAIVKGLNVVDGESSVKMDEIKNKINDMFADADYKVKFDLGSIFEDLELDAIGFDDIESKVNNLFTDHDGISIKLPVKDAAIDTKDSVADIGDEIEEEMEQASDSMVEAEHKLENLSDAFKELVGYITKIGKSPKKFFDSLESGAQDVDDELKAILTSLKLIDENGNIQFTSLKGGFTNKGGFVSDNQTMIARSKKKENSFSGYSYLDKAKELQGLLAKAQQAGAKIGAIFDIIEVEGENLFYEIQNTVPGKAAFSHHNYTVNQDAVNASEAQIDDLIHTIKVLSQNGLYIDWGGDNVLYDKDKGFSIIDLGTMGGFSHTVSVQNTLQENIERMIEEMLLKASPDMKDVIQNAFSAKMYNAANKVLPADKQIQYAVTKPNQQQTRAIKQEETAHENNTDAIKKENKAIEAQIELKRKAQSMSWEEFALDESLSGLKNTAGIKSLGDLEQFWKGSNYAKQVDFKEIDSYVAKDIIENKIDDNLLSDWFGGANHNAKNKIENQILADDELRNAAMNWFYHLAKTYMSDVYGNFSFTDFLNSEIDVFRSDDGPVLYDHGKKLSFSLSAEKAKQITGGEKVEATKIKPIETIGNVSTGTFKKELEFFLPNYALPKGQDSLYINGKYSSFDEYYANLDRKKQEKLQGQIIYQEKKRIEDLLGKDITKLVRDASPKMAFHNDALDKFKQGIVPDSLTMYGDSVIDELADVYNNASDMQKKLIAYYASLNAMKIKTPSGKYQHQSIGQAGAIDALMKDPDGYKKFVNDTTGISKFNLFGGNAEDINEEAKAHLYSVMAIKKETDAQDDLNQKKQQAVITSKKQATYQDAVQAVQDAKMQSLVTPHFKEANDLYKGVIDVKTTLDDFDYMSSSGTYFDSKDDSIAHAEDLLKKVKEVEDLLGVNLNSVREYIQGVYQKYFDAIKNEVGGDEFNQIKQMLLSDIDNASFKLEKDDLKTLIKPLKDVFLTDQYQKDQGYYVDSITGEMLSVDDLFKQIEEVEQETDYNLDYINNYLADVYSNYINSASQSVDAVSESINISTKNINPQGIKDKLYDMWWYTASGTEKENDTYKLYNMVSDDVSDMSQIDLTEAYNLINKIESEYAEDLSDLKQYLLDKYGAVQKVEPQISQEDVVNKLYNMQNNASINSPEWSDKWDLYYGVKYKDDEGIELQTLYDLIDKIEAEYADDLSDVKQYLLDKYGAIQSSTDVVDSSKQSKSSTTLDYYDIKDQLGKLAFSDNYDKKILGSKLYNEISTAYFTDEEPNDIQSIYRLIDQIENEYSEDLSDIKQYLLDKYGAAASIPEIDVVVDDNEFTTVCNKLNDVINQTPIFGQSDKLQKLYSVLDALNYANSTDQTIIDDGFYFDPKNLKETKISTIFDLINEIESTYGENLDYVSDYLKQVYKNANLETHNVQEDFDDEIFVELDDDDTVSSKKQALSLGDSSQGIQNEIVTLESLQNKINDVITAVDFKTQAFENEDNAVKAVVENEINALKQLEAYLDSLKLIVNNLFDGFDVPNVPTIDANNTQFDAKNVKNISGGDWALDTTLKETNSILEIIFDALTSDDNSKLVTAVETAMNELKNVASGIIHQQKAQKIDTKAASARIADSTTYKQISDIARNAASGLGEIQLDSLTALKDGIVKVEGAFKNADGVWEGFSVKVNTANEAVDLAIKKQSAFAKSLNETSKQTQEATQAPKTKTVAGTSIKTQQDKFAVVSNKAAGYSQTSTVTKELNAYKNAMEELKKAQYELIHAENLSEDELEQKRNAFAIARDACNSYAQKIEQLIKASINFDKDHTSVTEDIGNFDLDSISGQEAALRRYVDTAYGGKATIVSFDNANKELIFTFKDGEGKVQQMAASFDASMTKIGSSVKEANKSTSLLGSLFGDLGKKWKELWVYASARFGVDEIIQQVRNGIQYVREIDSALTELKKVTDETDASYKRFLQDMSQTAGVVGSTVAELTTMSAEWARLGYSMEEAGQLAESTAILLNVSEFSDATEASEALISTMQAFSYTADESQHVVDILNEVGNNFAVSSDGIATALQDSASALMEGGNNLEQAVALVAAANKVVQDPNSVGSALRTISLRLRGTSVEVLEEMGEETDGVVSSVSKMQEKIRALTGVDIIDMNGAYKDTYTILFEIGKVWEKMSDIDQAALLELMAGKNRANTLAAILGNMEDLEGAYDVALNSNGSALKENEAYLNSIQGKIDILTNSVQTMWYNALNSDAIKFLLDVANALVKVVDKAGLLKSVFAILVGYFSFDAEKGNGLGMLNKIFPTLGNNITSLVGKLGLGKKAAALFGSALSSLAGFGISLAIQALWELGDALIVTKKEIREAAKEAEDAIDSISSEFKSKSKTVSEISGRFAELAQGVDMVSGKNLSLTTYDYEEFLDLSNQLADIFPTLSRNYDENGNAIVQLSGDTNTMVGSLQNLLEVERQIANQKIAEELPDLYKGVKLNSDEYKADLKTLKAQKETYESQLKYLNSGNLMKDLNSDLESGIISIYDEKAEAQALDSIRDSYLDVLDELDLAYSELTPDYKYDEELGYDKVVGYSFQIDYGGMTEEEIAKTKEKVAAGIRDVAATYSNEIGNLNNKIQTTVNQNKANWGSILSSITSWVSTESSYQVLNDDMQNVVKQMINNIDFSELDDIDKWEDMQKYIQENIILKIQGATPEVQNAFSELFKISPKDIETGDYINALKKKAKEIEEMSNGLFNADEVLKNTGFQDVINQYETYASDIVKVLDDNLNGSQIKKLKKNVYSLAPDEMAKAFAIVKEYGIKTWSELQEALKNKTFDVVVDYDVEAAGFDKLQTALSETASSTGLSAESIAALQEQYQDLEGYDASRLFEQTASGIRLNTQAARELEDEYERLNKEALDNKLDGLVDQYNDLTEEIQGTSDAFKRAELYSQRQNILDQINDTATLAARYEGLTSAYNKWQTAQSGATERDMYEGILSGKEEIDEEIKRGWIDAGTREYLSLLSGEDLSAASFEEVLAVYKELNKEIKNSGYNVYDFFTKDDDGNSTVDGIYNFLDAVMAVQEEGKEWVKKNKDGSFSFDFSVNGGDKAIAEALGISEELIEIILRAAADAGFEINLESAYTELANLKDKAVEANERLKEIGATDYDFNINSTSIDNLNEQIKEAQRMVDAFNINKIKSELETLEKGGNVNLLMRPQIESSELEKAGWGEQGEGIATVYTNTYSNEAGNVAINFTPIVVDENGQYIETLSPQALQEYAEGVIAGTRADDLNLQIGAKFTGDDAIQKAEESAVKIHELHEKYYSEETQLAQTMLATLIYQKQTLDTAIILKMDVENPTTGLETVIQKLQEFKAAANELEVAIATGVDTTAAQKKVDEATASLKEAAKTADIDLNADLGIDLEKSATEINAKISSITPEMLLKIDPDTTLVDEYEAAEHTTEGEITWHNNLEEVTKWIADPTKDKKATGYVTWYSDTTQLTSPVAGGDFANGTAHIRGTAFAGGNWGAPRTETALVGELGPEMVVRGNRWFTVGDNGAEFTDIKKGDIIFNHKQTEDLLSKGYVTGRGKAYASGTAYREPKSSGLKYDLGSYGARQEQVALNNYLKLMEKQGKTLSEAYTKGAEAQKELTKKIEEYGDKGGGPSEQDSAVLRKETENAKGIQKAISDSSKAAEDAKDEVKEMVDFIEIKLEEIEQTIAKTTAELENYVDDTSTVSEKNNLYDNLVSAEKDRADTYLMAAEEYNRKATEALKEIPAEYRKMAMNGAIAIKDFVGEGQAEIAEAISNYRDWSNKADDAEVGYLESIAEQAALRVEQLQDIASDYENIIGVIETSSGLIEAHMDFVEESGKRLSATYYNKLIKNSEEQKKKLEEERKDLQRIFDRAVRSGDVEKGSDEWYEMLDAIYEVDEAIVQCNTDIEEFNNSINELKFENLEKLIDRFDDIDSQLSHLHDRFTDGKIVDDEGDWNSDGIAAIGVLTQQMEVAEMKSRQYAEAIDELKEDYKNGLYSEDEFNEKLAELTENQWDAIESYESAKDAIVDLNKTRIDAVKDGIQEEIDAYKELIDKKKEALDADKDLYDFEKNVKEQQKDIATIERKLAALSGDTSASAAAQRKVLEAELAEAKANLEDTYRDRSIENQKNALDDAYEKFEEAKNKEMEALDEYLEREDEVIGDSVDIVKEKENAKTILEELKAVSEQYGIDISNAIVSPWEDGANAVMSYDNQFGEVSESFIAKLQAIIDKEKELQKEADNTATGIINGIEESEKDTTSAKRKSSSGGSSRDDGIRGWTDEELAASEVGAPQGGSSGGSNSISKGQTVVVDKNAKNFSSKSGNASMASFVKGGTYEVMQTSGNQVLIGKGGTATGWVDKKDLDGYAKGTTKIKDDQFAWIDEVGEELVLHAGSDGKLAYLTKGSGVIPADLTSKLMELALDPTQTLENSRPIINAPHITNNEINIDMTFGEVVHIDTVTNDTIPDLTKAVEKQMDKYMKNLNNQIRRYAK